ncbi:tRNA (N(6)-L-threonylcarbamoyladenosine(37)-C(2))-methylthiotransferase MtaB [Halothermothrix orenii]|nr:tRNA (N(6)-L-threonylcarbamoyladenosine(37)-C(2))-methylthiotransferase MtaB [Halothermothrix orenii]
MNTVAFHTLGCKVNHYETEAMMGIFEEAGYKVVDFDDRADVYIINSCTVTNEAARKSRQLARKARRKNPEAVVALVGCYAQVSPDEVKKIDAIDLVLGSDRRKDIVKLVEEVRTGGKEVTDVKDFKKLTTYEDLNINKVKETTRAYIKIEEGCNQFCSYCIIPYARGPVRSRKEESVIQEVERLVRAGVKEIVLTGTHLGAYGLDENNDKALVELIQNLVKVKGLARIRLSSLEVTEVNDDLIRIMGSEDKVCPHLHLPLQSGSNTILKKMKRPYTVEEFKETVDKIRKIIEDIAITTDIIVGFPGEGQKEFNESYNTVKELGFSRLHVFPFSIRQGTPAARMKNQVPGDVKKEYSKKMRELNKKLMLEYQKRFWGHLRDVIIEDNRDSRTNLLTGVTGNYIKVMIENADDSLRGKMCKVRLDKAYNHEYAIGKVIK